TPGLMPGLGLTVNGISDFNSAQLNENQRQITHYGVVALQEKLGPMDFQLSAFQRYSSLYFTPDPLGDLLFNGIAETAYRRSIATGTQFDGSYRVNDQHMVRAGRSLRRTRRAAAGIGAVLQRDGRAVMGPLLCEIACAARERPMLAYDVADRFRSVGWQPEDELAAAASPAAAAPTAKRSNNRLSEPIGSCGSLSPPIRHQEPSIIRATNGNCGSSKPPFDRGSGRDGKATWF